MGWAYQNAAQFPMFEQPNQLIDPQRLQIAVSLIHQLTRWSTS